tara:strand:+ start:93 stop:584 length:492 start_codon:yes stop_codon:yes gene_type:complete
VLIKKQIKMKKVLFTLLVVLLTTVSMSGQKLWKNEVDDFTGDVKKFTNYYNVAKTSTGILKLSALRINNFYYIKIKSTSDLGCSGASGNYVIFKFTDGTKIELRDDLSDIDCSDSMPSLFRIDFNSPLITKVVEKIRLRQSEYYTDGTTTGTYTVSQIIKATN